MSVNISFSKILQILCEGDLEKCRKLVELGADASIADDDGFTPAYIAQCMGYDEVFKFFAEETDID